MSAAAGPQPAPNAAPAPPGSGLSGPGDAKEVWRDRSLILLLLIQVVTIFVVVPGSANGLPLPWSVVALLLVAATALTMTIAGGKWIAWMALGLLAVDVGCAVTQQVRGVATSVPFEAASLVTSAVLCLVVGGAVFRSGPFNVYRVVGTIVFYLNVGLLFAFAHRVVGQLLPGSYSNLPAVFRQAEFHAATDYFSFITLTSIGYGDVVPVAPAARGLSMFEAVIGQLLPVLLISRAVSKMDG